MNCGFLLTVFRKSKVQSPKPKGVRADMNGEWLKESEERWAERGERRTESGENRNKLEKHVCKLDCHLKR